MLENQKQNGYKHNLFLNVKLTFYFYLLLFSYVIFDMLLYLLVLTESLFIKWTQ
jgi:hypothetical protein